MNNLKNKFAVGTMAAVILLGTTFANAGIIIAGATAPQPCTQDPAATETSKTKTYLNNFTGIIIAGFTGIIIAGATEPPPTETCGIIIAG